MDLGSVNFRLAQLRHTTANLPAQLSMVNARVQSVGIMSSF